MNWDYRPPGREGVLDFTIALDQSESPTQVCHVRILFTHCTFDPCVDIQILAHLSLTLKYVWLPYYGKSRSCSRYCFVS